MVDHNPIDSLLHGPNSKLFLAGGAVAVIVVYWEHRKSRLNAATAAPAATGTDTGSTDYSGSDYTGSDYGYGSDTSGLFSYADPASGAVISGAGSTVVTGPSTNAQWSQQVQGMLTAQGYSATDVAAALGHYLVGTAMNAQQWEIVQAGIALEGLPPQSVPPPNIAPVGGSSSVPADGYFVQDPFNLYYQVRGGRLFNISAATVARLKAEHVTFKKTTRNDPIYKLPKGTPNPI